MDEFRPDPSWYHWLPFAALMVRNAPPNRPMVTRILEQSLVGIIAGIGGAYVTIKVTLAVQDVQIHNLQGQIQVTEARLTDEIKELRAQMYWRERHGGGSGG